MLFQWFSRLHAGYCGDPDEYTCLARQEPTLFGDYYELGAALRQQFQDEFGHVPDGGDVFEVVAVPDDVAESLPPADGLVVLVGEHLTLND